MSDNAQYQQGVTVALATTGVTYSLTNVPPIVQKIPVLDCTDLSQTTGQRKKKPGRLPDIDQITLQLFNDPTQAEPALGVSEVVTVTGPVPTPSGTTGEAWSGSGFFVELSSPQFQSDSEGLQVKSYGLQFDGLTPLARTAAT